MATKEEMKRMIMILQCVMNADAEDKICCSSTASKMLSGVLSMPTTFPDDFERGMCDKGRTFVERVANHLAKAVSGKKFPELAA